MGMQDRDWYKEETARKARSASSRVRQESASPPALVGGSWHWAMQALVWLLVVLLLFLVFKVFERRRNDKLQMEKQIAAQQALIEQQRRQIEAMRPKPKVDFFK